MKENPPRARDLPIDLQRDNFCRQLIRDLAGTLEETVGVDQSEGFVSLVGRRIGDWIEQEYAKSFGAQWTQEQVAEVLVDLKRRIQGGFSVESQDAEKMVFQNTACPFGDKVKGRTSMCMMTSNVFGHIASKHCGYARVELEQTIAKGDPGCRVIVHLSNRDENGKGREYYGGDKRRAPT